MQTPDQTNKLIINFQLASESFLWPSKGYLVFLPF